MDPNRCSDVFFWFLHVWKHPLFMFKFPMASWELAQFRAVAPFRVNPCEGPEVRLGAMENGHRNSGFPHRTWWIFHSYVSLPEGTPKKNKVMKSGFGMLGMIHD